MSRFWYQDKKGAWQRKANPKARTPAWEAARAARHARRPARSLDDWQVRDAHGFIVRQIDGVVRLIDPGKIDRWLWENAGKDSDAE